MKTALITGGSRGIGAATARTLARAGYAVAINYHHSRREAEDLAAELAAELDKNPLLQGLTLSGGDPFFQAEECAALAREAKARGLDVWTYTGYTYEALRAEDRPDFRALLSATDVLVDGPFLVARKSYAALFRGSDNQRLIDLGRTRASGRMTLWTRPDALGHFVIPES